MYHSYFGIEEQVFSIAVNPKYMYMSDQHREALAHLLYGVKSGGFVMLTGEVGTGKTTTIRCLLEQLPANADVAIIMNPAASSRDLMCSICDEFGVQYDTDEASIKILTDKLYAFLLQNHTNERNSILLIDEAQLLRITTLEQIRLLTNLESHTQKMLQIILVGQPELNDVLAQPALRQLSQRITARYHLRPLNLNETSAYIRHRLTVAGMPPGRDPFSPVVVKKMHAISGGIPRLINILCDRMLLGAYSQEATTVDSRMFKQASEEVLGDPREKAFIRRHRLSPPLIYSGSAVAVALILLCVIWWLFRPAAPVPAASVVAGARVEQSASGVIESSTRRTRHQDEALTALLNHLGYQQESAAYPCWLANKNGMDCETLEAKTWDDFLAINRPAVLTLTSPTRHTVYASVINIEGNSATLLADGGEQTISLDELGALWTGEYVIIWRRPVLFDGAIRLGDSGPMVDWLAAQFANLDGQKTPLAQNTFNKMLDHRVKLFQRSHGIKDDGVVGVQTFLRLNEELGLEAPMQSRLPFDAPRQRLGADQ